MYIKQLKIKNIRSISDFEMNFPNPAGWHVLIGDNGAGKSTIVRAVAAALIGPFEIPAARLVWKDWLKKGEEEGTIDLEISIDKLYDKYKEDNKPYKDDLIWNKFRVKNENNKVISEFNLIHKKFTYPKHFNWDNNDGWFSAAYGPFRRFTGGDESKNIIFESSPKVGAHLSVFGEDVALTEALIWLKELEDVKLKKSVKDALNINRRKVLDLKEELNVFYKTKGSIGKDLEDYFRLKFEEVQVKVDELERVMKSEVIEGEIALLSYLKYFLNKSNLLPHNTKFEGFDEDENIIFKDGRGNTIPVVEMSDGYRSILSLIFDLIRQLIRVYGEDAVLANIKKGEMNIPVPGVVLIDEVDAHLHPTWQVRIGEWFTEYFPQIQFIVTTHSPLVCRAAKKGSIWQLATPVNGGTHKEITGLEKERLIYGNILDAYGTELFGASPVRSAESEEKKAKLGKLNTLFAIGKISKEEENERQELLKILSTDDPTGF